MSAIDKLFDLLNESQWSSFTPPTTRFELVKVETTEEMVIIPETPNGPMLEIRLKNKDGIAVSIQKLDLATVDGLIGRLIKMRDNMEKLKQ